jgi:hypothetical protein
LWVTSLIHQAVDDVLLVTTGGTRVHDLRCPPDTLPVCPLTTRGSSRSFRFPWVFLAPPPGSCLGGSAARRLAEPPRTLLLLRPLPGGLFSVFREPARSYWRRFAPRPIPSGAGTCASRSPLPHKARGLGNPTYGSSPFPAPPPVRRPIHPLGFPRSSPEGLSDHRSVYISLVPRSTARRLFSARISAFRGTPASASPGSLPLTLVGPGVMSSEEGG